MTEKPDTVTREQVIAFARAVARMMADSPFDGPGSLNDWRGMDAGTRGELNEDFFYAGNLQRRLIVRLSIVPEVPNHFEAVRSPVHEISFVDFCGDAFAAERIVETLRSELPQCERWGLRIELAVDSETAKIIPHPEQMGLGFFSAGRELDKDEVGSIVDRAWVKLQADISQELAFRRRFRVASERAWQFYATLLRRPGPTASCDSITAQRIAQDLKLRCESLVRQYRLGLPSDPENSAQPSQGACYLNLALHVLRKGDVALATELFMVALADFQPTVENWTTGESATRLLPYDLAGAISALGRRERAVLRLLLRRYDVWQKVEQRRREAFTQHALIAEEGRACWREITSWRMEVDGRVTSTIEGVMRNPEVVRSQYLSKHISNPYRRGLELYEEFSGKVGEPFAWGSVSGAVIFHPLMCLANLVPVSLLSDMTPQTWYAPDTRLQKLARACVPSIDDIEEILYAIHVQVDGDSAGIDNLRAAAFNYSIAALYQPIERG
jgi:hypothetical protein